MPARTAGALVYVIDVSPHVSLENDFALTARDGSVRLYGRSLAMDTAAAFRPETSKRR